ncbi:molybdopterin synthase sulfur carrier subunit [Microcoleus sp. T3_A4]|uniref:molybdopterin synthase sulfur carrier subunit n=1 Tax=Microcoleus sp. T3_A4 TaxID=2818968 RepID=UPI002FD0ACA3
MSNLPITFTVKLLAAYQEAEGLSEMKLEFPKETPVSQVLERLSAAPCSRSDRTGFGINQEFALAPPHSKTVIESSLFPLSALPFCPRTLPRCRFCLSPGGRSS